MKHLFENRLYLLTFLCVCSFAFILTNCSRAGFRPPANPDCWPDRFAVFENCKKIQQSCPELPSGSYSIEVDAQSVEVYCDMESAGGGWTQVVDFDSAKDNCPGDWQSYDHPRLCVLGEHNVPDCPSAFFASPQGDYQEVRGYVRGYQFASTDAFQRRFETPEGIDDVYVDGVSFSIGQNPRKHLWTYAAGLSQIVGVFPTNLCPCLGGDLAPGFLGSDYFCDSGNFEDGYDKKWYLDQPLWDEDSQNAACQSMGNPNWFVKTLSQPTREDIEVRLMSDDYGGDIGDEDIGVYRMEIYVR